MSGVFSELVGPAGIILLAAILGGAGAFFSAVKESRLRVKSEGNAQEQVELLQDVAARSGNRKELEELIRSRARSLSTDLVQADNIADGIIKRLPQLTAEWHALERNQRDAAEQEETEFRLNWEPLIRTVIQRFDDFVNQCQSRGLKIKLVKNDQFNVAGRMSGELLIRRAVFENGTELQLYYAGFVSDVRNHRDASIYIAGANLNLKLTMDKGTAHFTRDFFESPKTEVRDASVPQGGTPPKDFTDFIDETLRVAFQRLVMFASDSTGR